MLFAIFIVALFIGGVAGFAIASATVEKKNRLSKPERAEYLLLRNMRSSLYREAAQHVALGDNFASIVMDEITATEREIGQ